MNFLEVGMQAPHLTPSSRAQSIIYRSTSRMSAAPEADAATKKIENILEAGVVENIRRRQTDLREYLVDVEARLNTTIEDFLEQYKPEPAPPIPDAVAVVGGMVDQELNKVIMAINALTDKKLRFTLTAFLDDYKRILLSNREPEKMQIIGELEEHFKDGTDMFVNLEIETAEMKERLHMTEALEKKQKNLHSEMVSLIKQLKEAKAKAEMKAATLARDPDKSWSDAVAEMREILAKPNMPECLGKDLDVLKKNLDNIVIYLSATAKPFDLRSNSTVSNAQLRSSLGLSKGKPGSRKYTK